MTVYAISDRINNAQLIADCFTLGYLHDGDRVLDPTFGLGRFWSANRPVELVGCDVNVERSPIGYSIDFRSLPWPDGDFDAVVFDPPYKLNGTPSQGGPATSDADYGADTYTRWQDRHAVILAGITECVRVLRTNGYLLVKCQDQVSSGKVRWQTRIFADHAESVGCELVDMLHLVGGIPQPTGRRQVHARRNYSTLLICRKTVRP